MSAVHCCVVQQILTDVPDYVERCHYLESLKNRLEALLSPHVVAAFSTQSLGESCCVSFVLNRDVTSQSVTRSVLLCAEP